MNAAKTGEIAYGFQITPDELPPTYTPEGQNVFANGTKNVPANTVMDVNRYQQDLAALAPGHQLSLLSLNAMDRRFGDGYLQTWTLGAERAFGGLTADAAYVGTESFRLPRVSYPNAYPGAEAGFAPYTNFDSSGAITGGFGFESVITDTAHSSYNALQTSLAGQVGHGGPGLQAGYPGVSRSTMSAEFWAARARPATSSSSVRKIQTHARGERSVELRRDPRLHRERSPESASRKFAISPFERPCADKRLGVSEHLDHHQRIALHGVFRDPATGYGTVGADRPDQIGKPNLSTAHSSTRRREDYFGLGTNNASYFSIPIGIPGGTGPNSGRYGTLGRNTFRGPAYYDFDYALIKTTPIGPEIGRSNT